MRSIVNQKDPVDIGFGHKVCLAVFRASLVTHASYELSDIVMD